MLIATHHAHAPRGRKTLWGLIFLSVFILGTVPNIGSPEVKDEYLEPLSIPPISNADPTAFLSVWDTSCLSDGSSAIDQIRLPLTPEGNYNFLVQWGDGTSDVITSYSDPKVTHTYAPAGIYVVNITGNL
ncbi:MAG: hypothetical protein E4G98_04715, partial [Promethearchaeota archaeon]